MNEVYIVWTRGNDSVAYGMQADIIGVFWKEQDAQECADDYNDPLNELNNNCLNEAIVIKRSVN